MHDSEIYSLQVEQIEMIQERGALAPGLLICNTDACCLVGLSRSTSAAKTLECSAW